VGWRGTSRHREIPPMNLDKTDLTFAAIVAVLAIPLIVIAIHF
jgi:hypothetical protein